MRWKAIRDKFLIVPGYLIGLSCLLLITYRTIIAFLSESKAVTIHVNNYNEQFFDIAALVIIWIVIMIGLIFLIKLIRKEKPVKNKIYKFEKKPFLDLNLDKNKAGFIGFISKSSKNVEKKLDKEK